MVSKEVANYDKFEARFTKHENESYMSIIVLKTADNKNFQYSDKTLSNIKLFQNKIARIAKKDIYIV